MKKFLSLLLSIILLVGVAMLPVYAETVEITDEFLNAVREDYNNYSIQKDEIYIDYMKDVDNNKYLVRYSVADYMYTCDMVDIYVGDYHIYTSRPLPVIFTGGVIYEVEDAYNNGLLTDDDLDVMADFEELNMAKVKITEELQHRMNYYDDDDYVSIRFEVIGSEKTVNDIDGWAEDISSAYEELNGFYEGLHQKLLTEVLKGFEYIDHTHNNGVSVVSLKKSDIEKVADFEFVTRMDYISEVHLRYIEEFEPKFNEYVYDEKCRKFDENGEPSYYLINAHNAMGSEVVVGFRFGDVIVESPAIYSNFTYGFGIYDINEDKFYDVYDLRDTPYKYYDLEDTLAFFSRAKTAGDVDCDGQISIMDAAKIQRCLANLDILSDDTYTSHFLNGASFVSDVDNDGEVSVMDATAIQLKIAKL